MAALLTFVKVARAVRDSARAAAELLPRGLAEPLLRQERELQSFLDGVSGAMSVTAHQAEAIVESLYERIEVIEARLSRSRLGSILQRRAVASLRDAVIDLELILIPDRQKDFALLGVSRSDDLATVKSKFRALARRHHPDTGGDTHRMEELNRAYRVVSRMRGGR